MNTITRNGLSNNQHTDVIAFHPLNNKLRHTITHVLGFLALFVSVIFSSNLYATGTTIGTNYRDLFNLEHEITPYTNSLFGEQIGLSTGSITFKQTDVSILGNFDLPVAVTRAFNGTDSLSSVTREFGSWGFELPHVRSNMLADSGTLNFHGGWGAGTACSSDLGKFNNLSVIYDGNYINETGKSFWNGDNISIPGKGSVKLLNNGGQRATNNHWKIEKKK